VLELTGNNDLSDADCRFNKSDIDYAVPGTIQRCARAPRMHADCRVLDSASLVSGWPRQGGAAPGRFNLRAEGPWGPTRRSTPAVAASSPYLQVKVGAMEVGGTSFAAACRV